jgi:hypothetical protein
LDLRLILKAGTWQLKACSFAISFQYLDVSEKQQLEDSFQIVYRQVKGKICVPVLS